MRDAVAILCVILSQAVLGAMTVVVNLNPDWILSRPRAVMGVFAVPLIFLIRFGLGAKRDARLEAAGGRLSVKELTSDYGRFRRGVGRRNVAELIAGILIVAMSVPVLLDVEVAVASVGWPWCVGHLMFIGNLALRGAARKLPETDKFSTIREHYKEELARQGSLRRYVWWYPIPMFTAIIVQTIAPAILDGEIERALFGMGAMILLALLIARLTSDRNRMFKNNQDLLSAMQEG